MGCIGKFTEGSVDIASFYEYSIGFTERLLRPLSSHVMTSWVKVGSHG